MRGKNLSLNRRRKGESAVREGGAGEPCRGFCAGELGGLQKGIAGNFRGVKRNLAGGGYTFEGEAEGNDAFLKEGDFTRVALENEKKRRRPVFESTARKKTI